MKTTTKRIIAGSGAAAATMAAAAATYYLYGAPKAAQNRKKVAGWARKAEREIVREARELKEKAYTDANINRIIAAVAARYKQAEDLEAEDVKRFVTAVSEQWKKSGSKALKRAKQKRPVAKKKKS